MSFLKRFIDKKTVIEQSSSPKITCPYCGTDLQSKPTRKKKCPSCGQYILVRKGNLLTEDDAKIIDWLDRLNGFNIDRRAFDKHRDALTKQFGFQAPVNDTLWRIFTLLKRESRGHQDLKWVSLHMAEILREEGKDPTPHLADALREELLDYKESGVLFVQVSTCNDRHVCRSCEALTEQIFSIDDALKMMPIPHACVSTTKCRCGYVPVVNMPK